MNNQNLENRIQELAQKIDTLEKRYHIHQHDGIDGTNVLRKGIDLDDDQFLGVGLGGHGSAPISNIGTVKEQLQYSMAVGKNDGRTGFVNKLDALQMDLLHLPRNTALQSFITARRTPMVAAFQNTSITVTATQNTVTITGFNFVTNELAGALINIINSSGTFIESRVIASNTATVITISGAWGATTNGGTFEIYAPVFFGSAQYIWQRFYAQEGEAGGIRFGMGVTDGAQDQNGLLYMDATGDLYWRPKTGAVVKLGGGSSNIIGDASQIQISSGALTVTSGFHLVLSETAGDDDVDTINVSGISNGFILVLQAVNDSRTITMKDGTGNLKLAGDFALDNIEDTIFLIKYGSNWFEISRSDNGA